RATSLSTHRSFMRFSSAATIQALATCFLAPDHRLACAPSLWNAGLAELHRRGAGQRESGAFLLGERVRQRGVERRRVQRFAYYDDLDPNSLDTGIVVFDGSGFGPLWQLCREARLEVVADVHTHPGVAGRSHADRRNP